MTGLLSLNENLNKTPKSCLSCRLNLQCQKPKKAFNYLCKDYESFKAKKTANKKPTKQIKLEKTPKFEIIKKRGGKVEKRRISDDSDEFQFKAVIKDAIKAEKESPLPRDLRIDDRDLPQAKNFYEFLTSKKFMNIAPFAKQLEIGINMMAEWCPRCSNPDYIWDVPKRDTPEDFLSEVQLLEWGVCPNCKVTKSELYCEGELDVPWQMAGLAGQRSSKSTTTCLIIAYQWHGYLKIPHPLKAFGLLETANLQGTYVALTWKKAKELLFDNITNNVRECKWFQEYHALLDDYQQKTGEKVYNVSDVVASYKHRNMLMYPSGPDNRTLRGSTAFSGAIDEIGMFPVDDVEGKVKMNGEETYTSLSNAFLTVKPAYYRILKKGNYDALLPPLLLNTSSPRSKKDMICRLVEQAQDDPEVYSYHYCVSGDTLLPTDSGIQKIKDLATHNSKPISKNINIKLLGEQGIVQSKEWHYTGKKEIFKVTAKSGHFIKTSANHEIKVFRNGKHEWIRLKNLVIGDFLCINPNESTRQSELSLNLTNFDEIKSTRKDLLRKASKPTHMNEKLAYLLGATVAEGSVFGNTINIPNANLKYLNHLDNIAKSVFDVEPTRILHAKKGSSFTHKGTIYRNNKNLWQCHIGSLVVRQWFEELGVTQSKADKKIIPWSILQADEKSQLAFLAAYIESDGYISNKQCRIGIASKSKKLLSQLQIIFNSHGIMTIKSGKNLYTASSNEAVKLYGKIVPYLVFKHTILLAPKEASRNYGFPAQDTLDLIKSRQVKKHNTDCYDDNGNIVKFQHCSYHDKNVIFRMKRNLFIYAEYDKGRYDNMFKDFERISPSQFDNIKEALDLRYWYVPVNQIKSSGKQDTYDLTINKNSSPAFVANGIVIHNSTWEMNPHISKKDLASKFKNNYIAAMRDYGAVPPNSSAPYIENIDDVSDCLNDIVINRYKIKQVYIENGKGLQSIGGDLKIVGQKDHNKRIMALDAGRVNNSFAICLGYFDTNKNIPVFDGLIEIQPTDDLKISFTSVFDDIILPIIDHANVQLLVADRWQGEKFLDDAAAMAENPELMVETHSVKYGDFFSLREDLLNGGIDLPRSETKISKIERLAEDDYPLGFMEKPVAHFLYQLVTVRDNLKDVDKGDGTTDDLLRALVLAYAYLVDPEYQELVSGVTNATKPQGALLAVGSLGSNYAPMSAFNSGGIVSAGSMGSSK